MQFTSPGLDAVQDDRTNTLLALTGIAKQFAGFKALDGIELDIRRGEVHVLFGENGAGKSTLINIIAGVLHPDAGNYLWQGETVSQLTPSKARSIGISPVFQEFSLIPELTIEENLFLGREIAFGGILDIEAMKQRAQALIDRLGFELPMTAKVGTLTRARQQMVEIAKALLADVKLLILDEPTASLTEKETERLFQLINELKQEGIGIIYVSHRMREIRRLADRITILRDGRRIRTVIAANVSDNELIELMTGRKIEVQFPVIHRRSGEVVLSVRELSTASGTIDGIDFEARAGEITGIAGLVGCGKSELIRAIYGLEDTTAGAISIRGVAYHKPTPRRSLTQGIAYFPSDRVTEGLALERAIRENATMSAMDVGTFTFRGLIRSAKERAVVQPIVEQLNLRPANIERAVGRLSGGNRQKVMLARGLMRDTQIFLFDEPTVGIDVGAKLDVYEFMQSLVDQGAAVVLVSSELPEVLSLSNPVYVMHQGRVANLLRDNDITEQRVLESFFQVGTQPAHPLPAG
ncbi:MULTISPECIES: sugar ABC transporter ATP-binding protein [Agrobacterium]|uniref:Sugar ABC transporter ATP-binding protein n=1 Tax=Agrobacterium rubi TaxID=28099 RepID=A0AAE7UTY9_9HYPH|nr:MULTISPECIES: sugar ABC transporter ATP-binding protein [Agrobacterium]MBN7808927.1 sugar ABC transporter ATP-binding protein [Agrobacterium rosae]NTE89871.1 sugar ABC transporter ATP-binding protein [Agrobacterium rubi]NTF05279.1 sugar ABC transporter ATP-binding protein [Agrobacterium rubi]NTF39723.1 sugar ABC transporter ATP-binding protein [Agrobacterium rubi]OCJ44956.1 sugar ABC transporter ATP-binding protein [Agrobacterium rubi]